MLNMRKATMYLMAFRLVVKPVHAELVENALINEIFLLENFIIIVKFFK